jgi:hypothetical protein
MNRDLAIVLFSAVLATLNPSLVVATTVMLLLPQPKRVMLSYLLGAYTSSIIAGLAIVFSLHGSSLVQSSSHRLSPAGDIAVGVLVLAVALVLATGRDAALRRWRVRRKEARAGTSKARQPWHTRMLEKGTMGVAFVVGAGMSFPGVSYVNALDHIAHLNPPTVTILLLIGYFCVMQQIVLEGALLASVFAGEWTQAAIVSSKAWFARHGRQIATIGLSGVGILLAGRGLLAVY